MEIEEVPNREIIIGSLMAIFFITGFITSQTLDNGEKTNIEPDKEKEAPENINVGKETVKENGKNYLTQGPLSYPFTYNLSTEKIQKTSLGNTNMYNWTISYTVEANPLQGATYSVPGNQTQTEKRMNLYITEDGRHLFPSTPIQIGR